MIFVTRILQNNRLTAAIITIYPSKQNFYTIPISKDIISKIVQKALKDSNKKSPAKCRGSKFYETLIMRLLLQIQKICYLLFF